MKKVVGITAGLILLLAGIIVFSSKLYSIKKNNDTKEASKAPYGDVKEFTYKDHDYLWFTPGTFNWTKGTPVHSPECMNPRCVKQREFFENLDIVSLENE